MLGTRLKTAFRHPNPNLQFPWNLAQIGLFIFPLSPFLGAVTLGLASLKTWLRQHRTIIQSPLNWGFALLGVLLIISSAFAENKTEAFLGLFNFLPFFLFFAGFSALIQTPTQLRQLSWNLVISSIPVVIIGFGQLFLGWTSKLEILWIVLEINILPQGDPRGRMASIFMHANTLAAYLVIVFILGLGLWLESFQQLRGRGQGAGGQKDKETRGQGDKEDKEEISISPLSPPSPPLSFLFLTAVLITNFAALILTNSRNAWAIAIAACLAYAVYQGWRILIAFVSGVVASVMLAAFAPQAIAVIFRKVVPAFFWARLNDQMYPDRPTALMRKTQWQFAWSLAEQRPWTGWGLRNFTALYKAHSQIRLGHPHNLFLMLSAETGLPSTLLYCGLLGWILFAGVQVLRRSKDIDHKDKLILFSYLLVLVGWVLFNTADVTLFDFRLNTLAWLLFSSVCGVVYRYKNV
ncbi:O-antigen polymerase [Tolypothrix sp. NIES-4075]|uniref:O-antigen ligase family protein n=1 Tax=Tolypothrix sp. NIES-4075 TaxID=2005459 RepID=UPI000B5C3B0F|nr:O-antigen ligase family protein [Tolypothrix sp. NIES-4075]GAX40655.1 O-antigen polymerase [Tolypothrix sp. NIES-4075]